MKLSRRSSEIKSLGVRILPSAFILFKPPFRDEPLYIEYALKLLEDPLNPYPDMGFYIPHPPGMMYRIALGLKLGVNLRVRMALLNLLCFLVLYRYTKNTYPLAVPGVALYSFIIFDDAPGAFLAAASIHALIKKRYKEAAILYVLASLMRFQSAVIAMAYALRLMLREREPRNLVALLGVLPILTHYGYGTAYHPSYVPFLRNLTYLVSPAFLLLLLPVAYFDRHSRELLFVSYVINSLFGFVGYPLGYDRYYLITAIFMASRMDLIDRNKCRICVKIPGISTLTPKLSKYYEDLFFVLARIITLISSYNLYIYPIPHPPYDTFYLSRGEYHHFSDPLALIIAIKIDVASLF